MQSFDCKNPDSTMANKLNIVSSYGFGDLTDQGLLGIIFEFVSKDPVVAREGSIIWAIRNCSNICYMTENNKFHLFSKALTGDDSIKFEIVKQNLGYTGKYDKAQMKRYFDTIIVLNLNLMFSN